MTGNEYQSLAMRTLNPKQSDRENLINGVMGLCGESGEVADLVKKHLFHAHPLNREDMVKELGDVAWYIAQCATALGIELDEILETNIEKLKKRYPDGFDTEKSLHRSADDT